MIGENSNTRLPCSVPGCTRTALAKRFDTATGTVIGTEVICHYHWRLIPRSIKAVYRRATRDFLKDPVGNRDRWNKLWARCRRIAIEGGLGL